jgi:amino acid transporter
VLVAAPCGCLAGAVGVLPIVVVAWLLALLACLGCVGGWLVGCLSTSFPENVLKGTGKFISYFVEDRFKIICPLDR